ncbi:hypothetical protein LPBF_03910 [Flavobacterium crassostreae]|uniref:Uncharacterized protein n=1 Tax=Flavobacterium crassostreae TaxID=1763534 RepID=A0A1B9E823_9FLAO|nr:hypothetical protein LPBF_03910 [Flavobacterium crassostreae]
MPQIVSQVLNFIGVSGTLCVCKWKALKFCCLFFLRSVAERPKKAPASTVEKKRLQDQNLEPITGIGTLFYLFCKKEGSK